MAINRSGQVYVGVGFDPKGLGVVGGLTKERLIDIWDGEKRSRWKQVHVEGKRKEVPLCSYCDFWGVPTGF